MKNRDVQKTQRLFLVEDSPVIRRQTAELLSDVDNVSIVGEADNVETAIRDILKSKPDVILLDVQIPGGSGIDILKEIKVKLPATKFIVITNHALSHYREKCMALGADYFFDKSFEFNQIPSALAKLSL